MKPDELVSNDPDYTGNKFQDDCICLFVLLLVIIIIIIYYLLVMTN